MAIEIKHGGGATGSAPGQIIGSGLQAAQQRTLQEKQLAANLLSELANAARTRGGGGGGGGGGGRGPQADPLTLAGFKAQLAKGAQEQKFAQEMEAKQEEARLQANQFDYEYSQKSKQEIAKINRARQTLHSSPNFNQDEIAAGDRELDRQLMGITQDAMPADPNRWKGDPAQGPNMAWKEQGGFFRRADDGQVELLLKPSETPEGLAAAAEAKIDAANLTRQQTMEDNAISARNDTNAAILKNLQETEIEVPDLEAGLDEDGKIPMTTRLRRPAEWMQEYLTLTGQQRPIGQPQQIQQPQAPQPAPPEQPQTPQMTAENADAIFESLAPGDEYIGPDGVRRRKPGLLPQIPIPFGRIQ